MARCSMIAQVRGFPNVSGPQLTTLILPFMLHVSHVPACHAAAASFPVTRLFQDVKVAAPFAAVAVSKAGVDVKAPGTVVEVAKKPGERPKVQLGDGTIVLTQTAKTWSSFDRV